MNINAITHPPIAITAAVVVSTALAFGTSAVDSSIASNNVFNIVPVVHDTVIVSISGTDGTTHAPGAHTSAFVAFTDTAFSAGAVDINLGSETAFVIGAAVYDTITVSVAGTDASDHEAFTHSAAGSASALATLSS